MSCKPGLMPNPTIEWIEWAESPAKNIPLEYSRSAISPENYHLFELIIDISLMIYQAKELSASSNIIETIYLGS